MAAGETLIDIGSIVYSGADINAAGTTQGTATAITTDTVRVTTAIGQTGVILPATPGYARLFIDHLAGGAASMNLFPPTGGQINALGANNAANLATGAQIEAWSVKADNSQWYTR